MSLIVCGECGKLISDTAETCPKCGAEVTPELINKGKKRQFYSGLFLLIAFVLMFLVCFKSSKTQEENNNNISYCYKDSLTISDRATILYYCEEAVKAQLKSPSTAKFDMYKEFISKAQICLSGDFCCTFTASGFVDSQNSFGAIVRSSWVAKVNYNEQKKEFSVIECVVGN